MKQFIAILLCIGIMIASVVVIASCVDKENEVTTYQVTTNPPRTSTTSAVIPETTVKVEASSNTTAPNDTNPPEPEVTTYYNITAEERDMLATLCYLEASICSPECQRAIVSVIFNRLESGKWRKDMNKDGEITLYDIVYYPNAFTPSGLIDSYKNKTTQDCYDAVDYVVANGPTVPTYVRYFRTNYHFSWDGYEGYCDMDNVYFGYMADWQKGAW